MPEDTRYWISEAWSARKSADGTHLVPDAKISGTGISWCPNDDAAKKMTRFWLEEYGRIGKGEPFFVVEAEFKLSVASDEQPSAPEQAA